jgi:hypothetical protein
MSSASRNFLKRCAVKASLMLKVFRMFDRSATVCAAWRMKAMRFNPLPGSLSAGTIRPPCTFIAIVVSVSLGYWVTIRWAEFCAMAIADLESRSALTTASILVGLTSPGFALPWISLTH